MNLYAILRRDGFADGPTLEAAAPAPALASESDGGVILGDERPPHY